MGESINDLQIAAYKREANKPYTAVMSGTAVVQLTASILYGATVSSGLGAATDTIAFYSGTGTEGSIYLKMLLGAASGARTVVDVPAVGVDFPAGMFCSVLTASATSVLCNVVYR